MGLFFKLARRALTRRSMYRFSRKLHLLGLHGMGVLNWETPERSGEAVFLEKHLPALAGRKAVVLDVGAHHGEYSRRVVAALPDAQVLAFEPHPVSFAALEAAAPEGVRCFPLGLSDEPGTLTLYDYSDADGSAHASLYRGVIEDLHGGDSRSHEVPVRTVDDVVEEFSLPHIALLKVDAEGHELRILQGAARTLEQGLIDAIHFEFNTMHVVSGCHFKDFVDLLPGYRFHRMLPYGLVALPAYDPVRCEIFAYQNIVALREGIGSP